MNNDLAVWNNLNISCLSLPLLAEVIEPKCNYKIKTFPRYIVNCAIASGDEKVKHSIVPRFHYVTKKEEADILSGAWDENQNYEEDIMPYGMYFPDCYLGELKRVLSGGYDPVIEEFINPFCVENNILIFSKQMLFMGVFIVLHEYGHYYDFLRFENKAEYAKHVYISKAPFRRFVDDYKQGLIHGDVNYEYSKTYRMCADEKAADDYAKQYLELAVDKAMQYLLSIRNEEI